MRWEPAYGALLNKKYFYLHFQPKIDLNSKKIIGAEVLLRWHTHQWGDVSSVEFKTILEDTGLIDTVVESLLMEVCKAYMSLQGRLEPDFKIAVNLSGRQFKVHLWRLMPEMFYNK